MVKDHIQSKLISNLGENQDNSSNINFGKPVETEVENKIKEELSKEIN